MLAKLRAAWAALRHTPTDLGKTAFDAWASVSAEERELWAAAKQKLSPQELKAIAIRVAGQALHLAANIGKLRG